MNNFFRNSQSEERKITQGANKNSKQINKKKGRENASDQTRLILIMYLIGRKSSTHFPNQSQLSKTNAIPRYFRCSKLKSAQRKMLKISKHEREIKNI